MSAKDEQIAALAFDAGWCGALKGVADYADFVAANVRSHVTRAAQPEVLATLEALKVLTVELQQRSARPWLDRAGGMDLAELVRDGEG